MYLIVYKVVSKKVDVIYNILVMLIYNIFSGT